MRLQWNGSSYDCVAKELMPSAIREGDFILYHNELCWIETIQRDVPRIEHLTRFTMFTLRNNHGDLIAADDVYGRREVYRETISSRLERRKINALGKQ